MMVIGLMVVFVGLQVLRFCFAGTRQRDRLLAAACCGLIGALALVPGVQTTIESLTGLQGAATVLRLNFFFATLWLVRGAFAEAVHGTDRRRWSTGVMLTVVCLVTWLLLMAGVHDPRLTAIREAMLEAGFKPSLQYILCLGYIAAVCLEIAGCALRIYAEAKTRAVRISGALVCVGTAAIGITSVARACLYTTIVVNLGTGRGIQELAAETEDVLVAVSMAAGAVAVIGTSLPTVPVGGQWIIDYFRAWIVLARISPLWKRAARSRGGYLTGIRSVAFADPVARLHRRTVEIRDAQLAGAVKLSPSERALVTNAEAWLSRPQGGTQ